MEFEWDDAKSDTCLAQRGFDFAYAIRAFLDDNRMLGRDRRWDYGEDRYWLLGAIEGRVFVVIFYHAWFGNSYHFGAQGQRQGGSGV